MPVKMEEELHPRKISGSRPCLHVNLPEKHKCSTQKDMLEGIANDTERHPLKQLPELTSSEEHNSSDNNSSIDSTVDSQSNKNTSCTFQSAPTINDDCHAKSNELKYDLKVKESEDILNSEHKSNSNSQENNNPFINESLSSTVSDECHTTSSSSINSEAKENVKKRNSRTEYNPMQVEYLNKVFQEQPYPDADKLEAISKDLGVPEVKLKLWFQNKRARWRRGSQVASVQQTPPPPPPPLPPPQPQPTPQYIFVPILCPVPYPFPQGDQTPTTSSAPNNTNWMYPYSYPGFFGPQVPTGNPVVGVSDMNTSVKTESNLSIVSDMSTPVKTESNLSIPIKIEINSDSDD